MKLESVYKPAVQNNAGYRKCPQAAFHSAQIFTTNFLVLFTNIKVIQEISKLCYSYDWIEQLFYILTVCKSRVWEALS